MDESVNDVIATSTCSLNEQRILLLAPTGKDARLSQVFLAEAGLHCAFVRVSQTCARGWKRALGCW